MTNLAAVPKPVIHLDLDTHRYYVNAREVPGVTSVIADLTDFRFVSPETLRAAGEFGTAAHKACELYDLDDLDLESLDPSLEPYLRAWIKFKADTGFEATHIEHKVYSTAYSYAGTIDRVGLLRNCGPKRAVVDIKSGSTVGPVTGLQLAGYEQAYREYDGHQEPMERYAVHLRGDGTYRLLPFTEYGDRATFLSCLQRHKWRQKWNKK